MCQVLQGYQIYVSWGGSLVQEYQEFQVYQVLQGYQIYVSWGGSVCQVLYLCVWMGYWKMADHEREMRLNQRYFWVDTADFPS